MKMLVSGASGLIGEALIARLESDRHTVHRVVRRAPAEGEAFLDVDKRRLDCSRLPGGNLDRIDAVFNLSGERITPTRWSAAKKERLRTSRVVVTDLLSRSIAATVEPPSVFVSASASGYYGDRGDEELDEESTPGRGFLADLCRAWEAATNAARDAGVRVVNVRTGLVIAKQSPLVFAQLPLFRLGLGPHLGSGRQWMPWISLDDEVDGIIHAAFTPTIDGPCNLSAPDPVRNKTFAAAFAKVVGSRSRYGVPSFVLEAALGRETAHETALASQRLVPRQLIETGFPFADRSLEHALARAIDPEGTRRLRRHSRAS